MKIKNVLIDTKQLFIRGAKGKKDRVTLLSDKIIVSLKHYIHKQQPTEYLFEGAKGNEYSQSSLRRVFKNSLKKKLNCLYPIGFMIWDIVLLHIY